MALSDSNRVRLSIAKETTFGVTPDPFNRSIMRITGESLNPEKQTEISAELRSDRMVSDLVEVGFQTSGSVDAEVSLGGDFDPLIASALGGAFAVGEVDFTGTVDVDSLGTITTAGAFTNAVVGQHFLLTNATNSTLNKWYRIDTKTSNDEVVVYPLPSASEVVTNGTIKGKSVKNGVLKDSYSVEKSFLDIGVHEIINGLVVGKWELNAVSKQIATMSFDFMGTKFAVSNAQSAGTLTNPTNADVVNATSNLGCIEVEGVASVTPIKEISISLDNKLRNLDATCSKYAIDIGQGRQEITGDLTAYFKDKNLLDLYLQHGSVAISFGFADADGNGLHVYLPKVKFSENEHTAGGIDQDIMQELSFTALYDPTANCQIQVDIAN